MKKPVIDSKEFNLLLSQIASGFVEKESVQLKKGNLCVIGIQTRGAVLANRIAKLLKQKHQLNVEVGSLDITLYRDDVGEIGSQPIVKESDIPLSIDGYSILLVDDVLYTGRTIRAALDALLERGRPRMIRLATLIDRGGRELPIQADYVAKKMTVKKGEKIQIQVKELDKKEGVWIF